MVRSRKEVPVRRTTTSAQPQIEPLRLNDLSEADPSELAAHQSYDGLRLSDARVPGWNLSGSTFNECELVGWSADETDFRGARFIQVWIDQLNAPTLSARRTTWRDVEVTTSRIGAAEIYDAQLSRVAFSNSKLGWVNFRSTKLHDVVFRNCRFDELDLSGAQIERVRFEGCSTEKLALTNTRAQHLDLRGLDTQVLEGFEGLRGAILSSRQVDSMASLFAQHFGITIADED